MPDTRLPDARSSGHRCFKGRLFSFFKKKKKKKKKKKEKEKVKKKKKKKKKKKCRKSCLHKIPAVMNLMHSI